MRGSLRSQPDTLPSLLGRELGGTYETFNFGISGMNFEGMGQMTQLFGLKYRPDVAVYSFICDDVSKTDSVSIFRWRRPLRRLIDALPASIGHRINVESLLVGWKMARYTSDFRALLLVPPLYRQRIEVVLDYLYLLAARNGHEIVLVDYCRNDNFTAAVRHRDAVHGSHTVVINDFPVELNSNDHHPTAACNRAITARLAPVLRAARARREAGTVPSPSPR